MNPQTNMIYEKGKNPNSRNGFKANNCDHNAFKTITNESSYWAGFLAADGNISKNERIVTFGLKYSDIKTVEKFKEFTKTSNKITTYNSKCKGKTFQFCIIGITSKKICEDLAINFNIVPQKSLILKPPNIESNFLDYYIKGYIDGDGCIYFHKNEGLRISAVGTFDLLSKTKSRFEEILISKAGMSIYKQKGKNCYTLSVSNSSARNLFTHYYKLQYGLERKWTKEKYKLVTEWIDKKTTKGDDRRLRIHQLLKTKSVKEISGIFNCSIQNIYFIINGDRYKTIKASLDAWEVSLEDDNSVEQEDV